VNSVRETALEILIRIDRHNAYAAPLLSRVMSRFQTRDRRLLVDLVYGTLRWRRILDWLIDRVSRRPVGKIDLSVLNLLRLGAYQLVYLSKIPSHAAVFTSVTLAKSLRGKGTGGYVNAVLRRISEEGRRWLEDLPRDRTAEALALRTSHPTWLVRRWIRLYGYSETEALCLANNEAPPATLRVNPRKVSRETLLEEAARVFGGRDVRLEPTRFARHGMRVWPLSAVFETDWLQEGKVTIQDEASQLIGEIVSPQPGERVLDACAGIGGKAVELLERAEGVLDLVCADAITWKLVQLRRSAERLGFLPPHCVAARLETAPLANRPIFDKVLLDAPCSNTGVLRRHPERKWRLEESDIERLAENQAVLLKAVASWIRRGGVLIYSTCSLEREEGEERVSRFLETHPAFSLESCAAHLGGEAQQLVRNGVLRTFPHREGLDGFFCARFTRSRS